MDGKESDEEVILEEIEPPLDIADYSHNAHAYANLLIDGTGYYYLLDNALAQFWFQIPAGWIHVAMNLDCSLAHPVTMSEPPDHAIYGCV